MVGKCDRTKDGEGAILGWRCSGAYSLSSTFAWAAAGAAARTDMAVIAINRRERMSNNLLGFWSGRNAGTRLRKPRKLTVNGHRKGHECLMYATRKDSAKSVRARSPTRARAMPDQTRLRYAVAGLC